MKMQKDNPVWCDVLKFYLAMTDPPKSGFTKNEYILEKLMQILSGNCYWHPRVHERFDEQIDSLERRYNPENPTP